MAYRAMHVLILILLGILLSASATPLTLDSRIGPYHVQITFIDGLPRAGEPTRMAVTVIDPQTQQPPDVPAILMITGGTSAYQLSLDRSPTTIISLPAFASASYDLRVQVPDVGITDALEMRIADPPVYPANPLLGSVFIIGGIGMLIVLILSDRFSPKKRRSQSAAGSQAESP